RPATVMLHGVPTPTDPRYLLLEDIDLAGCIHVSSPGLQSLLKVGTFGPGFNMCVPVCAWFVRARAHVYVCMFLCVCVV
ncbi:MAG: hypothetical protein P4L40_11460, partial [Terracidiphilus sp.]|nr:hypothetical protein [Terracidiphilus sp.]